MPTLLKRLQGAAKDILAAVLQPSCISVHCHFMQPFDAFFLINSGLHQTQAGQLRVRNVNIAQRKAPWRPKTVNRMLDRSMDWRRGMSQATLVRPAPALLSARRGWRGWSCPPSTRWCPPCGKSRLSRDAAAVSIPWNFRAFEPLQWSGLDGRGSARLSQGNCVIIKSFTTRELIQRRGALSRLLRKLLRRLQGFE